jgi:CDP-paratose 2-epimerase
MRIALVTGSGGLIGSQACNFFMDKGFDIIGIDNDLRSYFFGNESSVKPSVENLKSKIRGYRHYDIDIRSYDDLSKIFSTYNSDIEIIIHTAAQPSHDWAVKEPLTDFTVNALGTMNLLECYRKYCPKATFIFTSTNKVYGDRPNYSYTYNKSDDTYNGLQISEETTRWEARFSDGTLASIDEKLSIDDCKHSIFGASKVSADIMCQEYGKYFDLNVGVFRGGCLTGPNHAGAELHGFLSYLVKCILNNKPYTIYGYKGKQVRDNIHSFDLVNMFWHFHQNPKKGEVYNVGGGRNNSTSIIEAINTINHLQNTNWSNYKIVDENRIGDHIWYITDLSKFNKDYPEWEISIDLISTIKQMLDFEINRQK